MKKSMFKYFAAVLLLRNTRKAGTSWRPVFLSSWAALVVPLALFCGAIMADPVSSVVVYGDSLSDNGNLFALANQPGAPYYMGRLSNGPVAVEQLAATLGASLHDFAYAGATTGIGNTVDMGTTTSSGFANVPGMTSAYNATKSLITPFLGGLFIVWGGPDDLLSPSPLDTTPAAIVSRSVSDILAIVAGLKAQGATNILVPGMADLGLTPDYESQGPVIDAEASAFSSAFNAALQLGLAGTGVTYFDTAGLLSTVINNPAAYGFTDVTDACFTGTSLCSNPSQYLFFDSLHPTTAADALIAQEFIAASGSTAVPEPGSMFTLLAALLVAGGAHKFRRRISV